MTVCFMILAHSRPQQFLELTRIIKTRVEKQSLLSIKKLICRNLKLLMLILSAAGLTLTGEVIP